MVILVRLAPHQSSGVPGEGGGGDGGVMKIPLRYGIRAP